MAQSFTHHLLQFVYVAEASSDDDSLSLGSPGDLAEIPDADLDADTSSTVAPSSDVSSLTPTVNTKLGRVLEQLKGFVVDSQKDGPSSTTSKGDVVMDILSSDEEPGSDKPIERRGVSLPQRSPLQTLGQKKTHRKSSQC